jgi:predicted ribosomally synthesized peptide with SipW-like signal peptide
MKRKMILSLVMAAAVTLGASGMATNANFNATAVSNGNIFKMGTVALAGPTGEGQAINMDTLFYATNMGVDKVATKSTSITIKGSLPVVLSTDTITNPNYTDNGKNGPTLITNLRDVVVPPTTGPDAVISTYWRYYKMAITVSVNRYADNTVDTFTSRNGEFDSIFDTIQGTWHDGSTPTKGLNELLGCLGTLHNGDIVTITTQTKLVQTAGDGNGIPVTLTQAEINAFQGKTFSAGLTIVATEQ